MAAIRFIYFDLGNVIVNFDHHRAARQMAEVAGVSADNVWDAVFAGDLEAEYERGAISTREFYEAFCKRTQTQPDYGALLLAASDIFELNEAIVPLVDELLVRGHRLGILSNTNEAHWKLITSGRFPVVNDSFEQYSLSYEMRVSKPEPAAYEIAAQLAGVAPHEILFTDDRLDNVEGAREVGFDAIQFAESHALREQLRDRKLLD